MAYVGNQPVPQATQTRDRFVATSGQTSFATSGYTPGFVDVYLDGVKLDSAEYTATNGSDVVLATGASTGQILEVVAFSSFDVADIRNMTQPLGLKSYTTTERNALSNIGAGDTIYNSTTGSIEFYDGANWIATNLIPTVNSVSGTIYAGVASTLTLSLTNATDSVTVRFSEGGATIEDVTDVTVSSGSASVTVPSAVYGQSAGDTLTVSILNQDGTPSSNQITKTVVGIPSGGTVSDSGGYRYHTFTSSGTFTVPSGFSTTAQVLVVAGGAGGGGEHGGGGGAGGYIATTSSISSNSYSITVGAGGAGSTSPRPGQYGGDGGNSSAFGSTAIGGGSGGYRYANGRSGGSGGGAGADGDFSVGGSGTSGQGFAGGGSTGYGDPYQGGGGGGASEPGVTAQSGTNIATNGGDGKQWLDGNYYAGGGGGGVAYTGSEVYGLGGAGGGGRGATQTATAVSGTPNTGGGGGGANRYEASSNHYESSIGPAGSGGSGIVIVRYQLP